MTASTFFLSRIDRLPTVCDRRLALTQTPGQSALIDQWQRTEDNFCSEVELFSLATGHLPSILTGTIAAEHHQLQRYSCWSHIGHAPPHSSRMIVYSAVH